MKRTAEEAQWQNDNRKHKIKTNNSSVWERECVKDTTEKKNDNWILDGINSFNSHTYVNSYHEVEWQDKK